MLRVFLFGFIIGVLLSVLQIVRTPYLKKDKTLFRLLNENRSKFTLKENISLKFLLNKRARELLGKTKTHTVQLDQLEKILDTKPGVSQLQNTVRELFGKKTYEVPYYAKFEEEPDLGQNPPSELQPKA